MLTFESSITVIIADFVYLIASLGIVLHYDIKRAKMDSSIVSVEDLFKSVIVKSDLEDFNTITQYCIKNGIELEDLNFNDRIGFLRSMREIDTDKEDFAYFCIKIGL